MFDEMTSGIQQDTVRLLFHVRVEQKVEREQVAKVTGTNKDESGPRKPVQRAERKDISKRSMPVRKRQEI